LYSGALLSALNNSNRDWDLISFQINSLNTLLTSKYTIPLSTGLYTERTAIMQTRTCEHCYMKDFKTITDDEGNQSKEYFETQTKIPINEIKLYEQRLEFISQILSQQQTQMVWRCPKCSEVNLVSETPTSDVQYGSNATFGVMYERPIRTIINKSSIDRDSMKWVTDFLREIDMGLMAFQKAYFDEHGYGMKEEISPFSHGDIK